MKRQRNMVKVPKPRDGDRDNRAVDDEEQVPVKYGVVARKRKKKVAVKVNEEAEEKLKKIGKESSVAAAAAAAAAVESVVGWEEEAAKLWMSSDQGGVDEQMSWGLLWFPCWDMEFMGDAYYDQLYSDVVWDDDIWNLKTITRIPNP